MAVLSLLCGISGYEALAAAIISQAVKDRKSGRLSEESFSIFLESEWFQELSGGCDPGYFRRMMEKRGGRRK